MTSAKTAYLDTSAVVKLLMREPETAALRRGLQGWPRRASAALLRVEILRAVRRAGLPRLMTEARRQLEAIQLIRLDDDLLDRAADLDPPAMRSLDAIHLAAALSLGEDLAAVVTYDERMSVAANALGLPVTSPR
jgi:predicted nucleic acid-binding protein